MRDFWCPLILYPVALLAPILSPAPHSFGDSSSRQNTCNSVCRPQWAWRVSETVWGMAWEPAVDLLSSALPSRQGLWAEGHLPLQRLLRCHFLPPLLAGAALSPPPSGTGGRGLFSEGLCSAAGLGSEGVGAHPCASVSLPLSEHQSCTAYLSEQTCHPRPGSLRPRVWASPGGLEAAH